MESPTTEAEVEEIKVEKRPAISERMYTLTHELISRAREERKNRLSLRILSPPAIRHHHWKSYDRTDFQIRKDVSIEGQRVLTTLENSLVKIDLLAALPRLCQRMLQSLQIQMDSKVNIKSSGDGEGDGNKDEELKDILGPTCTQALLRLIAAQMAWKESKWGRIPWNSYGRSSRRVLAQPREKHVSDKLDLDLDLDRDLDVELDYNLHPDEGHEEQDKVNKSCLSTAHPTYGLKSYTSSNIQTASLRKQQQQQQQPRRGLVVSPPHSTEQEQKTSRKIKTKTTTTTSASAHSQKEEEEGERDVGDKEEKGQEKDRKQKERQSLISLLHKDVSTLTFLTDVLNMAIHIDKSPSPTTSPSPSTSTRARPSKYDSSHQTPNSVNVIEIENENEEEVTRVDALHDNRKDNKYKSLDHGLGRKHQLKESERRGAGGKDHNIDMTDRTALVTQTPHQSGNEGKKQRTGHVDVLGLIRQALQSKYEDHVRKALRDKDSKALICMLSLLPQRSTVREGGDAEGAGPIDRRANDAHLSPITITATTTTTTTNTTAHPSRQPQSPSTLTTAQESHPSLPTHDYYSQSHSRRTDATGTGTGTGTGSSSSSSSSSNSSIPTHINMDQPALHLHPAAASHPPPSSVSPYADEPHFPFLHSQSYSMSSSSSESSDSAEKEREMERRRRKMRRRQFTSRPSDFPRIHEETETESSDSPSSDSVRSDESSQVQDGDGRRGDESDLSRLEDASNEANVLDPDPQIGQDVALSSSSRSGTGTGTGSSSAKTSSAGRVSRIYRQTELSPDPDPTNKVQIQLFSSPNSPLEVGRETSALQEKSKSSKSRSTSTPTSTNMISWTSQKTTSKTRSEGGTEEEEVEEEEDVGENDQSDWEMTRMHFQCLPQVKAPSAELLAITEEEVSMEEEEETSFGSNGAAPGMATLRRRSRSESKSRYVNSDDESESGGGGWGEGRRGRGGSVDVDDEVGRGTESELELQFRLEEELKRRYQEALNLLLQNSNAMTWIRKEFMPEPRSKERPAKLGFGSGGLLRTETGAGPGPGGDDTGVTDGFKAFETLLIGLKELMRDRLSTNYHQNLALEQAMRERWRNEQRHYGQLKLLKKEMKELEMEHIPQMLTLDFQIRILNSRLRKVSKENFQDVREVIRESQLIGEMKIKGESLNLNQAENSLGEAGGETTILNNHHMMEIVKFKQIRNYLTGNLTEEIRRYDTKFFELQDTLDDFTEDTLVFEGKVAQMRKKYENIHSRYVDMKAEQKLKSIMRRTQEADEQRRHRAAKLIQDTWRKYKIRKKKREKRKGKKGGKKKAKK